MAYFDVTENDADTRQGELVTTATIVSATGLSTSPNQAKVTTDINTGPRTPTRTQSVYIPPFAAGSTSGTLVITMTVTDGAHSANTTVTINVIPDPYGTQSANLVTSSYSPNSYEAAAYTDLNNKVRGAFGALQQDTNLDAAARAHAAYLASNSGISSTETVGLTGFSGVAAADRAIAAGYTGTSVRDVAVIVPATASVVDAIKIMHNKLVSSVYRYAVITDTSRDVGIATATSANGSRVFVFVIGTKTTIQRPADINFYSYVPNVQINTPYSMDADAQNPVPEIGSACAGTPIFFQLRNDQPLAILSFTLSEISKTSGARVSVPVKLITSSTDPNHILTQNQAVIIPLQPLKLATPYEAHFVGPDSTTSLSANTYIQFVTSSTDDSVVYGCSPSK